jgi:DNA-binding transcriptional ArsR family regulator
MARIGHALAEPSRATILARLQSGTAHTATELAQAAGVALSTASEHLRILTDASLITVEPSGRHRYYRIASPEIAGWLEQLDQVFVPTDAMATPRRVDHQLLTARSCYDHLAGRLGVALCQALADQGSIELRDGSVSVTVTGRHRLAALGIDMAAIEAARRPKVRTCLDWTERRHHLAGSLGARLLAMFLDERWLIRKSADQRVLVLTSTGRSMFDRHFQVR